AALSMVPGAGAAEKMVPLTTPAFRGVSVYESFASWNPVINVEAPVVPIFPLTTVERPWLVIPADPPRPANVAADPRDTPVAGTVVLQRHDRAAVVEGARDAIAAPDDECAATARDFRERQRCAGCVDGAACTARRSAWARSHRAVSGLGEGQHGRERGGDGLV